MLSDLTLIFCDCLLIKIHIYTLLSLGWGAMTIHKSQGSGYIDLRYNWYLSNTFYYDSK
jgi:hypothetical protein